MHTYPAPPPPESSIAKWRDSGLGERAGAQEHVCDRGAVVAAAYGWPAGLADDDILARLFALDQERRQVERGAGGEQAACRPLFPSPRKGGRGRPRSNTLMPPPPHPHATPTAPP